MKLVIPALAAAFVATIGAGSAAQAAVIDFTFGTLGGTVSAAPEPLQDATQINLDGALIQVTATKPADASGLTAGNFFTLTQPGSLPPTDIIFGASSGPLATNVIKRWVATVGPNVGDVFTETLTTVSSIDRTSLNAVTIDLGGTVSDLDGLFTGQKVSLIIDATQSGGPGNLISISGSNSSAVPEPATWAMMVLGFIGLGYAAVRRSSKDRSAVAMI